MADDLWRVRSTAAKGKTMTAGPLSSEVLEREQRDRDETRRLAYAAIVGLRTGRPASVELAGSIANAVAHHSKLFTQEAAEDIAVQLVIGDREMLQTLRWLIDELTDVEPAMR